MIHLSKIVSKLRIKTEQRNDVGNAPQIPKAESPTVQRSVPGSGLFPWEMTFKARAPGGALGARFDAKATEMSHPIPWILAASTVKRAA
jgi:hypothetical protein